MAKCVFLLVVSMAVSELSPISGLSLPMLGPWSSSLADMSASEVVRQARDADYTFEDVANPCARYFQCLMPTNPPSFLGFVLHFYMQQATDRLIDICPDVEEEPDNCPRGRCSDFHLRTSFYAMPQIRYRFLNWSCHHQDDFEAGTNCWGGPFRSRMRECMGMYGNPGLKSPHMNLLLNCFDFVAMDLNDQCTAEDIAFINTMNRYLLQVWTEVYDNVNEDKK